MAIIKASQGAGAFPACRWWPNLGAGGAGLDLCVAVSRGEASQGPGTYGTGRSVPRPPWLHGCYVCMRAGPLPAPRDRVVEGMDTLQRGYDSCRASCAAPHRTGAARLAACCCRATNFPVQSDPFATMWLHKRCILAQTLVTCIHTQSGSQRVSLMAFVTIYCWEAGVLEAHAPAIGFGPPWPRWHWLCAGSTPAGASAASTAVRHRATGVTHQQTW